MSRFSNDATGAVVSVADEKDYRFGVGWTRVDGSAKAEPKTKSEKSETPDESWTNKELDAYAADHGIDFSNVSNKPSRLAAIAAHTGE